MNNMMEILDKKYNKYVAERVGQKKADKQLFSYFQYYSRACGVAANLDKEYDVGIALATDGLWLGYIAKVFEFPVIEVKLSRKGNGATWVPLDQIVEEDLKGKKVIVFDSDALTGRTLKRAGNEIQAYGPQFVDLLLVYENTPLSGKHYMKGNVPRGLPSPLEIYKNTWEKKIRII